MRQELTIAGLGGQGSIMAGVILGTAAVSHGGLYAVQNSAYSSELRGGFAAAWVVLSDEPVLYPRVTAPDFLVAQAQDSIDRFAQTLRPSGLLVYDSDMIPQPPDTIERSHAVAATGLARRMLDAPIVANMIMLGALCKVSGLVNSQALQKAIAAVVPPLKQELNLKAFALGMDQVSR